MKRHKHDRLRDIQSELLALMDEAKDLVRREGGITWERARSYWVPHIEMALSNDHSYLGGSMCSMEDTINELDPEDEEDCEEE